MAVSTAAAPATWRRHSTKEFTALAILIALLVFLVHQTTLSRENAELPMDRVLAELETHCQSAESTLTRLPPAFFGLGVWVDTPALLPGVHAALRLMKERLSGSAAANTFPPPTHSLHSFVRVQSSVRDAAVAELMRDVQTGNTVDAARVTQVFEQVASQQQLGMPTMKHAFLPEIGQEVELHGLSLFSVPAELLQPAESAVRCFLADVRQAYCLFPVASAKEAIAVKGEEVDSETAGEGETPSSKTEEVVSAVSLSPTSYHTHAASLADEVRAALLSVMTRQMGLQTFKPADVAAWKVEREQQGCVYTVASVKSTLRSIEANTNMVIPLNTRHMFADLERHVAAQAFVRAARAADDLQFHPSLTPQLYIPWDHSLVSQLVILLPMVSTTILALRFVVDERRRHRRSLATSAATAEKKEQ